jgi:hypothetical protein
MVVVVVVVEVDTMLQQLDGVNGLLLLLRSSPGSRCNRGSP